MTSKTIHKSKGKTTGLGICAFFAYLFKVNEVSPKKHKKTDQMIALEVEREFPDRPTAYCFLGDTKTRTINEYRHRYNTGKFTGARLPDVMSFRYDSDGDRVDFRTGKDKLHSFEISCILSAFQYYHKLGSD